MVETLPYSEANLTYAESLSDPKHIWIDGARIVIEQGGSFPSVGEQLMEAKATAKQIIDTKAGEVRLRFPSPGALIDIEYTMARDDAIAFRAAGYTGEVPESVASWATAKGWTPKQASDDILATAEIWYAVLNLVRAARINGKEAVETASDNAGVTAALASALSNLDAIMP